jgi:hypothetical protein
VILEKKNLESIFERELLNIGVRVLCGRGEQEESKHQSRKKTPHLITVKDASLNFKAETHRDSVIEHTFSRRHSGQARITGWGSATRNPRISTTRQTDGGILHRNF